MAEYTRDEFSNPFEETLSEHDVQTHVLTWIAEELCHFHEQIQVARRAHLHSEHPHVCGGPTEGLRDERTWPERLADLLDGHIEQATVLAHALIALKRDVGLSHHGEQYSTEGTEGTAATREE